MNLFLLNLFLSISWMLILGDYSRIGFFSGFIIGFVALWLTRPLYGKNNYFHKTWGIFSLVFFFAAELFLSSIRVLWDIVTPLMRSNPEIIELPLDAKTDLDIMLVANFISLTPGTLSIDLNKNKTRIRIHAMFVDDKQALIHSIKNGIEKRLLTTLRSAD